MGQQLKFQFGHSRNGHDYTLAKTPTGRLCLLANEKGVHLRMGLIMTFLRKNPSSNKEEIVKALHKVHRSYNINDLSQPFKQMRKVGMLKTNGRGRAATYQLTPNAVRIFEALEVEFA